MKRLLVGAALATTLAATFIAPTAEATAADAPRCKTFTQDYGGKWEIKACVTKVGRTSRHIAFVKKLPRNAKCRIRVWAGTTTFANPGWSWAKDDPRPCALGDYQATLGGGWPPHVKAVTRVLVQTPNGDNTFIDFRSPTVQLAPA